MHEELHIAGNLLHAALDRYIAACSILHNGRPYKNTANYSAELSDIVDQQLGLVESYKSKLTHAQVIVRRARNNLPNVSINALPNEVLAHIFHLVLAEQPCPIQVTDLWDSESPVRFPAYPDTLSQVCSRWRQAALASHGLWSHIDIALSCSLSRGFHERAATYASRAHQTPLDVHFIDPGCIRQVVRPLAAYDSGSEQGSSDVDDRFDEWINWSVSMYEHNPEEFTFLSSSPPPHINSLGLLVQYEYHPIHSRALEHCLINCLPRGLSKLIIDVPCASSYTTFFHTSLDSTRDHASGIELALSDERLESAWHPTTALVLKGMYPRWTSSAYSGLTELRFYGKREISSSELVCLLQSSPGLRIIHCDFIIRDAHPDSTLTTPVLLQDLQILDLRGMYKADVERFLRCLTPGSGSLRLSLNHDPTSVLEDFYARSNVRELQVETVFRLLGEPNLTPDMYCLPPQLHTLVLIRWGFASLLNRPLPTSGRAHTSPSSSNARSRTIALDTLYMLSCRYDNFAQFQVAVAKFSPRRLVLWRCEIGHSASSTYHISLPFLVSTFGDNLSRLCSSVECLSSDDPNPLQYWD